MTAPVHARLLDADDVPAMRGILDVFASAFEEDGTQYLRQPDDTYLAGLLGKAHIIVVAACTGVTVVGGLVAYQLDKFEQDRREIYIYDLAVAAPFRRQGIATAMIEALRAEAIRRDAYVIFVQADLVDAPAIALYEKLGAKETAHHFDIDPNG